MNSPASSSLSREEKLARHSPEAAAIDAVFRRLESDLSVSEAVDFIVNVTLSSSRGPCVRSHVPSASSDALTKASAVKAWRRNNFQRWRRKTQGQVVADRSLADLQAEAQWCWDHYLDVIKLREIEDVCVQIYEVLHRLALVPTGFTGEVSKESLEKRTVQAKRLEARPAGKRPRVY